MEVALRRREQEVWQACDDLWALGGDTTNLTGDAIRERLISLGKSRGSPNEIYRYRKTWALSRGIGNEGARLDNQEEHDPITRAVRLVHEKLINEADEKIETLKKDHGVELAEKDRQLEQGQANVAQVIRELSQASEELNKARAEIATLNQQLAAEIEIRRAQEREVAHVKTSHQHILQEVKSAHQDFCERQAQLYLNAQAERQAHIERLEAEKKQLGFEFSEKLTELKTCNYNQALLVNSLQAELAELTSAHERQSELVAAQNIKFRSLMDECTLLEQTKQSLTAQIVHLLEAQQASRLALAQLQHRAKKHELTIARLRAIQAYARGPHEPVIAFTKRAAQGAFAAQRKASSPIEYVQDPGP